VWTDDEKPATAEPAAEGQSAPAESGAMQANVDELTAQLSTATTESTRLATEHAAALKERDELTARIKTADELAKTLTAERDGAQRKLAALIAGEPPVSSASAETEPQGSLMQRARKKK
jgi:chromosome segregation ATPase